MRQTVTQWDLVRGDYMAGMSFKELCLKYKIKEPTLCKQVVRGQWAKRKVEITAQLHKVQSLEVLHDAQGMVEQGRAMLAEMMEDARNSVRLLMTDYANPVGFDELEKRERTAGMMVKRIRETAGLDDAKQAGLVVIGQFTRFDDSQEAKTIDVSVNVTPDNPVKE